MEGCTTTIIAYVFMTDDARTFAVGHAINFWPLLMCIGRPILLEFTKRTRTEAEFAVRSKSTTFWSRVDSGVELDSHTGYVLFPITIIYRIKDSDGEKDIEGRLGPFLVQGLLLRKADQATFQRIGTTDIGMRQILGEVQVTRPRLIQIS